MDREPPEADDPQETAELERYGRFRVPRPRPLLSPEVELHEVHRGSKPGSRYVRLTPRRQQKLRKVSPGYLEATEAILRPPSPIGRAWSLFKRIVVGTPLASGQIIHEKLSKVKALAIFSSDALSSSAYATEEILLVLILAG